MLYKHAPDDHGQQRDDQLRQLCHVISLVAHRSETSTRLMSCSTVSVRMQTLSLSLLLNTPALEERERAAQRMSVSWELAVATYRAGRSGSGRTAHSPAGTMRHAGECRCTASMKTTMFIMRPGWHQCDAAEMLHSTQHCIRPDVACSTIFKPCFSRNFSHIFS